MVVEKKLKNGGELNNLPYDSYDYSKVRFHCYYHWCFFLERTYVGFHVRNQGRIFRGGAGEWGGVRAPHLVMSSSHTP